MHARRVCEPSAKSGASRGRKIDALGTIHSGSRAPLAVYPRRAPEAPGITRPAHLLDELRQGQAKRRGSNEIADPACSPPDICFTRSPDRQTAWMYDIADGTRIDRSAAMRRSAPPGRWHTTLLACRASIRPVTRTSSTDSPPFARPSVPESTGVLHNSFESVALANQPRTVSAFNPLGTTRVIFPYCN